MDEDGFYLGELNGRRGLVPSNFLEPMQQSQLSEQDHHYSIRAGDRDLKVARKQQVLIVMILNLIKIVKLIFF